MVLLNAAHINPAYLIDAIEGAREAYDEWKAAEAAAAPLMAASLAAISAAAGKIRWEGGPGGAFEAPERGVSTAEYDTVRLAKRAAANDLAVNERKISRAKHRFDTLMSSGGTLSVRQRTAAAVALEQHETAVAAWAALVEALDARDAAHFYAGAPGRGWWTKAYAGNGQADQAAAEAIWGLGNRVEHFDVDAVAELVKEV
jgi:hypothetical protein